MTCVKTGARVYLPDYNIAYPADLYRIGDVISIRFTRNPQESEWAYVKKMPKDTTHIVYCNPEWLCEQWMDRGILVVHESLVHEVHNGNSPAQHE